MANLLLLADVASKNSAVKPQTTDASVQTEFYFNSEDDGGRPFFQQCPGGGNSNETNGGTGNLFELPDLPPLHDYVKQTDFDYVVNAMHDYYNRLAPPDREFEHSYAVFGEGASDTTTATNGLPDDGCFEAIANLDEYMGINQNLPDQSLLCEEVFDEQPLFVGGELYQIGDELFDQLSICSVDIRAVVPLEELDVDELIEYICPAKEKISTDQATSSTVRDNGETTGCENSPENFQYEPTLPQSASSSSNTGDLSSGNQPVQVRCGWRGCGQLIEVNDRNAFEEHILIDHLPRKKNRQSLDNSQRWICQWDECQRMEEFSHRYQLLRHIRQHTMETPFHCDPCNRSFKSKELLNVHERRAHNRVKQCVCNVCSKSFASTGDLSRHKRTHLLNATSDYLCGQCGAAYKDESGLRKHRKRIHEVDGSAVCKGAG